MHLTIATLFLLLFCCRLSVAQSPLHKRFDSVQQHSGGALGVFACLLETGDTISFNGNKHFPMQSVYKVPINMVVLKAVDCRELSLSQRYSLQPFQVFKKGHSEIRRKYPNGGISLTLLDLLRYNVVESDGVACDILLDIMKGPSHVDSLIHMMGISAIAIATTEKAQQENATLQYQNWISPAAAVQLLDTLFNGTYLSAASRNLLLQQMRQSTPSFARINRKLPAGTPTAHKSGTAATGKNGITGATNDIGILTLPNGRHIAIGVFISDSRATMFQREDAIGQAAKIVWDHWYHPR
ncbi:class A beta-lactamase [Chitinophaga sp. Hz27]|uniref:class A beta-lactamase n=1 Tax=Chitinophaga sp. Hz27 TaxID=3347169 RepID=UPI0035DBC493